MFRSRILGTGRAVPDRVVTNDDLAKLVETSDEWVRERTGIRERRVLPPELATSDLGAEAARKACEMAGVPVGDVDCIVVGTVTADMPMPSCAVMIQQKLGITKANCASFDVAAACAGFIYALSVGDAMLRSGSYRRVLVIGAELLTRWLDWKDRNTCVLFGDGAGAVLLGPEDEKTGRGVLSTHLYTDPSGIPHLNIPGGGSLRPTTAQTVAENLHVMKMNGKAVFAHAVKNLAGSCQAALDANRRTPSDIDLIVAHQANLRIVQGVADRMGVPLEKFFLNIDRYGNTSSASVPIALDEAVRAGKVKDKMQLLFCALGAGFSWGSALVTC
jgi:3-oxoacyl-[acyl-carrier-protein] synthase-3